MASLEILPNEILIQITNNLSNKELQACRLVSSLMREKIDKLVNAQLCIIFNEKSEREFIAKKKLPLTPHFTRMRIESVSYFNNSNKKTVSLRKEYFQSITELEIAGFVPKHYFHKIMKLTGNLRILKLSSAILGGTKNLFGKYGEPVNKTAKARQMLFLRRPLPQPVIQNLLQREQNNQIVQQNRNSKKWSMLEELYIKLDYVCPSTPNFSPHWLVENLKTVQNLPVPKLSVFALTVERSKEEKMFYFTINSLLSTIPLVAFPSLKSVSVMSPKCRPISQKESLQKCQTSKQIFSQMQLSDFTVKICEGHNHAIPDNLMAILEAQQSLENVSIEGIRNAHMLTLMN